MLIEEKMKYIFLILLIDTCYSQLDGGFWWLKDSNIKKQVTTKGPVITSTLSNTQERSERKVGSLSPVKKEEVVCCECVNFYLCVNGTINSDGTGLINVRIGGEPEEPVVNVNICPGDFDVCCTVPDADPSCHKNDSKLISTEPPDNYQFTPHPESNCECLSYSSCDPELVVSDGLGETTIELINGRMVNHSKCTHALDVCCFLPEIYIGNETEPLSSTVSPAGGEICECVPPYLCTPNGYIRTDGAGILDVRLGPTKPLKKCPTNPDQLCCLPPLQDTNKTDTSSPPTTDLPLPECGQRNAKGIGVRVLGFKEDQTQFGEFPWVATLLKKELVMGSVQPLFLGGASLIHPRVVLTAAHKVQGIPWESLMVRLGEWDTAFEKEFLPHQDINVQQVIFHSRFVKSTLFHDVALLILEEEANQQYNIWPICPAKSLSNVNDSSCVINGWGVDAFKSGKYQKIMKSITLPLVRRIQCEQLLKKTRLGKYFKLHTSFLCAGGEEGMDACKGDGGGPLACPRLDDPTKYLQVGITAWGIGCGTKDVPGVYADVTKHYDWITSNIKRLFPESLNPTPGFEQASTRPEIKDNKWIRKENKREQKIERRKEKELRKQRRKNQRKENRNLRNID